MSFRLIGIGLLSVFVTTTVFAASGSALQYADVRANAWYAAAISSLRIAGILDTTQKQFHPQAMATRAEFLKLLLAIAQKQPGTPPLLQSFDDTHPSDWFYATMEEAAKQGWIHGDRNCFGLHPCLARPKAGISRAEAAVLLSRALGVEQTGKAPPFIDADPAAWYAYGIGAAADHCILFGDAATTAVRPHDPIVRAEMAVLLYRATLKQKYGTDCGKTSHSSGATSHH
jgi:hypothetical protein